MKIKLKLRHNFNVQDLVTYYDFVKLDDNDLVDMRLDKFKNVYLRCRCSVGDTLIIQAPSERYHVYNYFYKKNKTKCNTTVKQLLLIPDLIINDVVVNIAYEDEEVD